MAEEQKENQAQNGTQETRLPLSIDRSKEISKYMNVFNASFAYNEVFLEMGLGRVLDEADAASADAPCYSRVLNWLRARFADWM